MILTKVKLFEFEKSYYRGFEWCDQLDQRHTPKYFTQNKASVIPRLLFTVLFGLISYRSILARGQPSFGSFILD